MKNKVIDLYNYLMPAFVFVPYKDNITLSVNANDKVSVFTTLGISDNAVVYSYASGVLLGKKEVKTTCADNSALVIENDFRDKKLRCCGVIKDEVSLTRKQVENLISKFKYNLNFDSSKPLYITYSYSKDNLSDSYLYAEQTEDILQSIDYITSLYDIKNACIIIDNSDDYSYQALTKYMGTYYNISCNNRLPKSSTNVINVNDVLEIYYLCKYNLLYKEKYITINENKKIYVVKVKLGTLTKEILDYLGITKCKYAYGKTKIALGDNTIITKDTTHIGEN